MTTLRHTVLTIVLAAASLGANAQTAAEHTQHHPTESAPKALKAPPAKSPSKPNEAVVAMDGKIKAMREMHEKMMAAKTPEERKALMGDHMKAMQGGMDMMTKMGSMGGMQDKGGMPMDMMGMHTMMEKRMEMMTTMMQMMMDRMPTTPAP
jgi:hypothetical protein